MKTSLIRILIAALLLALVGTAGAQEEGGAVEGEQAPAFEGGLEPTPFPDPLQGIESAPFAELPAESGSAQEGGLSEGMFTEPGLFGDYVPAETLLVNATTGTVLTGDPCPNPVTSATYKTIQAAVNCAPNLSFPNVSTLNIAAGTYNENVTIAKNLAVVGDSAAGVIVNGGDNGRVFTITGSVTVGFLRLTITNGTAENGAGIHTDSATVGIGYSTISANTATGDGGGVYSAAGTVVISSSTLTGNSAASEGGGVYTSAGSISLYNSTMTGNTATTSGGGAYTSAGTLILTNATIAANTAPQGSNIITSLGFVSPSNTIIANGSGSANCAGTITSGGYNLSNDASCGLTQASDKPGQNPMLGALASNGGQTQTMALQPGSPAINAGSNTICASLVISNLDQRGTTRPQGAVCDIGAFELVGGAPVNLIQNGSFSTPGTGSNPPPPWVVFGLPTPPPWSLVSGVFNFHRVAGSTQGVIYQQTNTAVAADGVLEAEFQLGNSSAVRKRALILIHDGDFSDSSACTFWLPANTPLRTYRMKMRTTEAWTNATLSIYASNPADGAAALQVDNVSMYALTGDTFKGTLCTDPGVPAPPSGADSANLLNNFDFSAPLNPTSAVDAWSYFNQINAQIVSGVANIYRTGTPRGNLFQEDLTVTNAGVPLEVTFQMGNSHSQRMRVVILIHKRNFGDLGVCTFWLPPNTPMGSYTLRTVANIDWTDGTAISFYPDTLYTPAPAGRVLLDNVVMRRRPSLTVAGTECYEPGQAVPAGAAVEPLTAPTLEPTATPMLPPGELPLLATPVPILPAEASIPSEGSAGTEQLGGE